MNFWSNIKKGIFPFIIAFSAISVSASAAFYSITGLSKLFAGASLEVIIMATSLEISKLVIASLLYQYWDTLNKALRFYLMSAAIILVLITSVGIYGFLSGAYQETATKSSTIDKEVSLLELKKERFVESRNYYLDEKKLIEQNISDLRKGLTTNVQQKVDKKTGQIITSSSSENRKALQQELTSATKTRDELSKNIEITTDSINSIEVKVLEIESNSELAAELGPLKYISQLTNIPMNMVVNYLLLIIVFVFDPLAIALVITANFAFNRISRKKPEDKTPQPIVEEITTEDETEPTMVETEDPTTNDIEIPPTTTGNIMPVSASISDRYEMHTPNTTDRYEMNTPWGGNQTPPTPTPTPINKPLTYTKRESRNTRFDRF